ncbi:MAG: YbhB/YbcL family Raf kinase inhibitor-like protein [Terracidiphilus sp.]
MKQERREIGARKRAESNLGAASLLLAGLGVVWLWSGYLSSAHGQGREAVRIQSSSFVDGGAIPRQFTCDGAGISPALGWQNVPASARSLALVIHDPDAPIDFAHWVAYNIPAGARGLAEGASSRGAMPEGSAEGSNSFGRQGYGGPCPPPGKPHHYVFLLYALDARLNLKPGLTREQLEAAIRGHILAEGQIVGTYRRAVH